MRKHEKEEKEENEEKKDKKEKKEKNDNKGKKEFQAGYLDGGMWGGKIRKTQSTKFQTSFRQVPDKLKIMLCQNTVKYSAC